MWSVYLYVLYIYIYIYICVCVCVCVCVCKFSFAVLYIALCISHYLAIFWCFLRCSWLLLNYSSSWTFSFLSFNNLALCFVRGDEETQVNTRKPTSERASTATLYSLPILHNLSSACRWGLVMNARQSYCPFMLNCREPSMLSTGGWLNLSAVWRSCSDPSGQKTKSVFIGWESSNCCLCQLIPVSSARVTAWLHTSVRILTAAAAAPLQHDTRLLADNVSRSYLQSFCAGDVSSGLATRLILIRVSWEVGMVNLLLILLLCRNTWLFWGCCVNGALVRTWENPDVLLSWNSLARNIFQTPTTGPFTEPNAPTSRAKCLKKLRIVSRGVRQGSCFDIPGNCSVVERPFRLHCSDVLNSVVSPDLWQYSLSTADWYVTGIRPSPETHLSASFALFPIPLLFFASFHRLFLSTK